MRTALVTASLLIAGCSAAPSGAAVVRAGPGEVAGALRNARDGDRVVLAPGNYGDIVLPAADHAQPVVIDASAAKVRSLMIRSTAGWTWKGGVIDSPLPPTVQPFPRDAVWRNVMIDNARRIEIAGTTLTGGHTGVLVTRGSQDIVLRDILATGLQSDGFNIATAQRVSLIGNTCRDFTPIAPIFQNGRMVKDGTHPDCIMMWSEAGKPPTSDITITGTTIRGAMQGITHFWHPALGRDKVYRVKAWDNDVEVSFFHGIFLENTPGSDVRRNRVRTVKGATMLGNPAMKVTAWLKFDKGTPSCGNQVDGKRIDRGC